MQFRRWLFGLPPWVALGFLACGFDIYEDLCTRNEHCDVGEVCAVTERCHACTSEYCPAHIRCDGSLLDCTASSSPDYTECAADGMCRPHCYNNDGCPLSGVCRNGICAGYVGEPCVPETPCPVACVEGHCIE